MKIFYCVFLTLMAWVAPAFAGVSVSSPGPWRDGHLACSLCSDCHDEHMFKGRSVDGHLRKQQACLRSECDEAGP